MDRDRIACLSSIIETYVHPDLGMTVVEFYQNSNQRAFFGRSLRVNCELY